MLALRKILLCDYLYIAILIISLLYALIQTKIINYSSSYNGNETVFKVNLNSYKIDGNKLSLEVCSKEKIIVNYYFKTYEEKEDFINNISFNDILEIKGVLNKPINSTIPNGFDYKRYLYNNKIYYVLEAESVKLLEKNKNVFYKVKTFFYNRALSFKNPEYFYAFILGKTTLIDNEVTESYRTNGISHLFALSGLHVSLFALILLKIFKFFKLSEFKQYLFVFIVLMMFCFITSFTPSILRATLLFFLLGINKTFYFHIKTENILFVVFSIFVLINPFVIYNLGFQLSYTITYFLIISNRILKDKGKIKTSLIISLVSFLASFPIVINNFYFTNILGIIINLFFVPFVSIIVFPFTLITFILSFLENILYFLINIMESISLLFEKIKLFNLELPKINLVLVFIYYFILVLFIKKNKLWMPISSLIIIVMLFSFKNNLDNNTYIYFTDVGQGDSTLIVTSKDNTILIDTGGKVSYSALKWEKRKNKFSLCKSNLIPFYRSIGIKKINYMFLSHGDEDHAGEANCLINNFNVSNVFINMGEQNSLEKKLVKKEIFKYEVFKIDEVLIYSLNRSDYNNENDNSLVFLIKIYDYLFLFTGDISIKVEDDLLNNYNLPEVTVLKVAHHGSNTSTSERFVNQIKPKYSIISAGRDNSFGHPRSSVLKILKENNSYIYNTQTDGTIKLKINNKSLDIFNYKVLD